MDGLEILVATVIVALLFDFINGWNDAANAIATAWPPAYCAPGMLWGWPPC